MKYVLLALLSFLPRLCFSQAVYQCEINSNLPGVELPADEYAKKVKTFKYKAQEAPQGIKADNGEISAFLVTREGNIQVLLKELKNDNKAQANFLPAQTHIAFKLGTNHSLTCDYATNANAPTASSIDIANMKSDTDLLQLQAPFKVSILKSFLVQFSQSAEEMWTANFQNGTVLSSDKSIDKKFPRCFFTVRPKVQKGVWTPVRDSYVVHTASINQNNPSEMVWSLSFVDFASGKTKSESAEYTPFTLECVVLKRPFTLQQFNSITGYYLEFQAI